MQVSELATTSRQLGNKILEFKNSKVYGYNITAYKGYTPVECELVAVIDNPVDKVLSADTAYDKLFGEPQAPDFTKILA
jgi:hypothetical protein